jgi:hypothetical protein
MPFVSLWWHIGKDMVVALEEVDILFRIKNIFLQQ